MTFLFRKKMDFSGRWNTSVRDFSIPEKNAFSFPEKNDFSFPEKNDFSIPEKNDFSKFRKKMTFLDSGKSMTFLFAEKNAFSIPDAGTKYPGLKCFRTLGPQSQRFPPDQVP